MLVNENLILSADKKIPEKKHKTSGFFSVLFLIIFLISLTGCAYFVYGEINKELKIKNMEHDIRTYIKTPDNIKKVHQTKNTDNAVPVETVSDNNVQETCDDIYTFDWEGLFNRSRYVIGWIQIPGVNQVNYPIVQHPDDNQFFLTHDWTEAPLSAGAIFANKHNASDFTDMNTVIYGHRMKDGSMFGSLKQYKDQNFLDEHSYINIYTPDKRKLTYEIICYSSVIDGSEAYMMHFESPDERMDYYDLLIDNAITKRDIELNRFDTTIMLSTCNTTGYYDRLVILGKLIAVDLNGQPEEWEAE